MFHSPSWQTNIPIAGQKNPSHFMETESWLPCSQKSVLVIVMCHINLIHDLSPLTSILILLSCQLCLGLPSVIFLQALPPKPCVNFVLPHTSRWLRTSHLPWFHHPKTVRWTIYITKPLTVQFSSSPLYFFLLRPKAPCFLTSSAYVPSWMRKTKDRP
jgi:hypothetical protein